MPNTDGAALATPRRSIFPFILLCVLGLVLFLIACAIVLSLIPLYLPQRAVDAQTTGPLQFSAKIRLSNGSLPLGSLSAENCGAIQTLLREKAQMSAVVRPSVPTVTQCTVSQNASAIARRRRESQGNQIDVLGTIPPTGTCRFTSCLLLRLRTFLALLLTSGQFILNLVLADGTRANVAAVFIAASIVDSTTTNPNLVFYGLNGQNQLLRFNAQTPTVALATVNVSRLNGNEKLLSIDFRPATGQLYGITDGSRLYTIDQDTGVAVPIGGVLTPMINGSVVSIDFNPTVDRLRLVTNAGQNLRLNPETGTVAAVDRPISGGSIVAVAYTNNRAGASNTTLFDIDSANTSLFQQNPPNDGVLVPISSSLRADRNSMIGFDISPSGLPLVSAIVGNVSQLYRLNTSTGDLGPSLGNLPQALSALAIPTDPVAYSAAVSNNSLIIFNPLDLSLPPVLKAMSGLATGESVLALDFRPVNGQLYALGNSSRLYTINTATGQATNISTGAAFTPSLSGSAFGFDFNPTVDRIRVVSNTGQNLRLNPNTGGLAAVDTSVTRNGSIITAAAYTNNTANASTTTLYVLDSATDRLFIQNPPNNGVLVDVGPLGIDVDNENGFDIGGKSTNAYALLTVNGVTSLYQINLATGAATNLGGFSLPVRALAMGLGF